MLGRLVGLGGVGLGEVIWGWILGGESEFRFVFDWVGVVEKGEREGRSVLLRKERGGLNRSGRYSGVCRRCVVRWFV